jgi:hypothetical protein
MLAGVSTAGRDGYGGFIASARWRWWLGGFPACVAVPAGQLPERVEK